MTSYRPTLALGLVFLVTVAMREAFPGDAPADAAVAAVAPGGELSLSSRQLETEGDATPGSTACHINVSARNSSRDDVYLSLSDSKVRMRRGWWARFKKWRSTGLGFGVFVPLRVPMPPLNPGKR